MINMKRHSLILGVIVTFGLVLRAAGIASRSLWFDEAFSWRVVSFPMMDMIGRVARDNHPPLYFILLKVWTSAFGTSEVALRSLSVLFGGATVVAAAALAREVVRARPGGDGEARTVISAGLISAALVAASVVQIRWAWETRMYTLGTALAACTSWIMLRAIRTRRLRDWILYGITSLMFAYTHYYSVFSLFAQALYVACLFLLPPGRGPKRGCAAPAAGHLLIASAIVVVGWSPWLPVFLAQRRQVSENYWTSPVRSEDIYRGMYRLFLTPENGGVDPTLAWSATAVAALATLALLIFRPGGGEIYLATAALLPLASAIALSQLGTDVYHPRYLLFGHVHFVVGAGVLVARIRGAGVRRGLAALLLANALLIDVGFWIHMRIYERPGMRSAIALVNSRWQPGDRIVVSHSLLFPSVLYYSSSAHGCYLYDDGTPVPHYAGAQVILPGESADESTLADFSTGRVWTINMRRGGWGFHRVPQLAGWRRVEERRFDEAYDVQGQIFVVLYEIVR